MVTRLYCAMPSRQPFIISILFHDPEPLETMHKVTAPFLVRLSTQMHARQHFARIIKNTLIHSHIPSYTMLFRSFGFDTSLHVTLRHPRFKYFGSCTALFLSLKLCLNNFYLHLNGLSDATIYCYLSMTTNLFTCI